MSIRLLFLGDSIAAESTVGFVPITINVISRTFHLTADSFNSSVPSSNVLDLLDRAQQLLPLEIQPFTAAAIFVGINDSEMLAQFHESLVPLDLFSRRLLMLVERLERAGVLVALCGPDGVPPSVTGHSVIAEALPVSLAKLLETAGVDRGR